MSTRFTFAAVALLFACGPEPMDVSGPWQGSHNLIITGSETAAGTEGISVTQTGGDINFYLAGCDVRAAQSGASTFDIYGFECTRLVNQKTWTLFGDGRSRISAGGSTFNMSISGDAQSGSEQAPFTWTFNGTR